MPRAPRRQKTRRKKEEVKKMQTVEQMRDDLQANQNRTEVEDEQLVELNAIMDIISGINSPGA